MAAGSTGLRGVPRVSIHYVRTEKWNAGVGDEVIMLAPALCNAIFAATGKRIRSLPIAVNDFRWPTA